MNNQTQEQFVGKIIQRKKKKVYHQASQFYQQIYYQLLVKTEAFLENQQKLFAYANKVNNIIWKVIENKTYLDKQYLFRAEKSKWGWVLLDLKPINNYL